MFMQREEGQQWRKCQGRALVDILIFVGASGSGKSTLIGHLLRMWPHYFVFCPSYTTRKPRPGEVDGKHYHFVSRKTFRQLIDSGEFLEYNILFSSKNHDDDSCEENRDTACSDVVYYGTSKKVMCDILQQNKVALMDTDIKGAINIKKYCATVATSTGNGGGSSDVGNTLPMLPKRVQVIWVQASSPLELETRLRNRGSESEASLQKRLAENKKWLHWYKMNPGFFHLVLFNHNLEACLHDLYDFITTHVLALNSKL